MYQVLIADDHPLFRAALIGSLKEMDLNFSIHESSTFEEARLHLSGQPIDLLLLDLTMPGNDGLLGLLRFRSEFPHLGIVVISANEEAKTISDVQGMGAMGFIPKSSKKEDIHLALVMVLSGNFSFPNVSLQSKSAELSNKLNSLTPKQLKVLHMIANGAVSYTHLTLPTIYSV